MDLEEFLVSEGGNPILLGCRDGAVGGYIATITVTPPHKFEGNI